MYHFVHKLAAIVCASGILLAMPLNAQADNHSSIEYHGGKKAYDKRIEEAAIRRAAEKIGDLRGSVEGKEGSYFLTEEDLKSQTSQLGFPVQTGPLIEREIMTGAIRIM